MSIQQVLHKVGKVAEKLGLKTQIGNGIPGRKYWRGLKKCFPNIAVRVQEIYNQTLIRQNKNNRQPCLNTRPDLTLVSPELTQKTSSETFQLAAGFDHSMIITTLTLTDHTPAPLPKTLINFINGNFSNYRERVDSQIDQRTWGVAPPTEEMAELSIIMRDAMMEACPTRSLTKSKKKKGLGTNKTIKKSIEETAEKRKQLQKEKSRLRRARRKNKPDDVIEAHRATVKEAKRLHRVAT